MMMKALTCIQRGWAVHPLYPKKSTPATPGGLFDAIRDPQRVSDLWEAMPGANIGIRCGVASGLWVLAVHGITGENSLKLRKKLPETLEVGRQGIRHLYFMWTPSSPVYGSLHLAEGLEAYGEGEFVVGPGSVLSNGARYTIQNDAPIIQAPYWLLQQIKDTCRVRLVRNQRGAVRSTLGNIFTVLTQDREIASVLRFNTFEEKPLLLRTPPWQCSPSLAYPRFLEHQDVTGALAWLERRYHGIRCTRKNVGEAIHAAAWVHGEVHPVREYLQNLTWDGISRCDHWLSDYLGAPSTDFVRTVSAKWLLSAVARVFRPGCRTKGVLVLEGFDTAIEALRTLVGPHGFQDNLTSFTGANAVFELCGVWVSCLHQTVEENLSSASLRAFVQRQSDRYRTKHARHALIRARQCVFVISRKGSGSHKNDPDSWRVPCHRFDEERLRNARDQIWAEAVHRFRSGESWEVGVAADDRDIHPWETELQSWAQEKTEITTRQALEQLGIRPSEQSRRHQMIAGCVLRHLGFDRIEQRRVPSSKSQRQRWYIRTSRIDCKVDSYIERTNR